jgi:hypothetical protein
MITGLFGHMNRSWRVSGASQKVRASAEPLEWVAIAPVEIDIARNGLLQHLLPCQPLGFSAGKVAVVLMMAARSSNRRTGGSVGGGTGVAIATQRRYGCGCGNGAGCRGCCCTIILVSAGTAR